MNDLTTFLTARLDERETALRQLAEARAGDAVPEITRGAMLIIEAAPDGREAEAFREVLADVAAKRRIVELYERGHDEVFADTPWGGCSDECQWDALLWVIRQHAAAFADHPDFDPAWRSDG